MAQPKFQLEVVTPDGPVFARSVTSLRAPGVDGQFGVLANHAPFMTSLDMGSIEAKDEQDTYILATSGGFIEVLLQKATILAETAELRENIDVERAKTAAERAQQRIARQSVDIDITRAELALAKAINRLKVAAIK